MKIFLTGGSGFIGQALVQALIQQGYQVTVLSRNPIKTQQQFTANIQNTHLRLNEHLTFIANLADYSNFNSFDAVINLAGEPIFNKAWTAEQKIELEQSRVTLTKQIVQLINQSSTPPKTFISASAAGYYGSQAEQYLNEQSNAGQGFTTSLCQAWEESAIQAKNTRICLLRTGMVLGKGGALSAILPLYRYGLGGKLGTGKQYWAWISLADAVNAIIFLLQHSQCTGVFNLCSPNPVRNSEFNAILSQLLHRPAWFTAPSWGLKLILGERANLLLDSQRLIPQHLLESGFHFQFADLKSALITALDEFGIKTR